MVLARLHASWACRDREPSTVCAYIGTAGLANRLRGHLAATLLASDAGRKVVPLWIRNEACAVRFEDLFGEMPAASQMRIPPTSTSLLSLLEPNGWRETSVVTSLLGEARARIKSISGTCLSVEWQYLAIENLVVGEPVLLVELRRLALAYLSRHGDPFVSFFDAHRDSPLVGVHIRRGDFVRLGLNHSSAYEYRQAFDNICNQQRLQGARALIATDADHLEMAEIRRAFGTNAEILSLLGPSRSTSESVIRAFAELLALAKCDAFVPTPKSSFSGVVPALQMALRGA